MAVTPSHAFPDGYTPLCSDCGVALCWDIGPEEYEARHAFWDAWRCKTCNPEAVGAWKREKMRIIAVL